MPNGFLVIEIKKHQGQHRQEHLCLLSNGDGDCVTFLRLTAYSLFLALCFDATLTSGIARSLRGRRLKGKGEFGRAKACGAPFPRPSRVVSRPNSLSPPFRTPATQATLPAALILYEQVLKFSSRDI